MEQKLFDGKSETGNFLFKKMLESLESPLRYRFSNPEKLVRASGVKPGQTVLEVGCGSGFFTPSISKLVGDQGHVHSIDLHPASVEETGRKVRELNLTNVKVSKANAHDTGLDAASVDLILLYGVVPSPVISVERLCEELHHLLKPEGILAVWTISLFWSPRSITQSRLFQHLGKTDGVHQFKRSQ